MKKISLLFVSSLVIFGGCKKSGTSAGNGGGGGNSATLTVTSFSPLHPYTSDELTITGTGFNPDKTKDTVIFNFQPATITSASATQLKLQFPPEANMSMSVCFCASFDVKANGKKLTVPNGIYFTRMCKLYNINDPDNGFLVGKPADSLVINGSGFTKSGNTFTIDGIALNNVKIDSQYNTAATLRLPKLIFGENNDETVMVTKTVTITNAAGQTDQKTFNFFTSPLMVVSDMHAEKNSYSLTALTGSGGVVNVTISGRSLKNDASLHLDGNTGIHTQSALGVSGFPDSITIPFTASALITGNYQVSVWRGGALYGACNFTVTN